MADSPCEGHRCGNDSTALPVGGLATKMIRLAPNVAAPRFPPLEKEELMKTIKVAVNKSEERPDGVEIEVVEPEGTLEQQTLGYLLNGFVRDAASRGTFKLDLPEQYTIAYQREGSFLLSTSPSGPNVRGSSATYYSPGKPLAVLAIHKLANRLDVVYGEISQGDDASKQPAAPAPARTAPPENAKTYEPSKAAAKTEDDKQDAKQDKNQTADSKK